MTVPGLRHVLDNGTIIFPPFPATDLEPSLHQQGLCRVQPDIISHNTELNMLEVEVGKFPEYGTNIRSDGATVV